MADRLNRRACLASATTALAATSGCLLFGIAHRGEAENASGFVSNDTATALTVTVRLVTPNGDIDYEQTYELPTGENGEFEYQHPNGQYSLVTETETGPSKSSEWDVTPCSSHVGITVEDERIEYFFSAC